jgi:hypothetical protein
LDVGCLPAMNLAPHEFIVGPLEAAASLKSREDNLVRAGLAELAPPCACEIG